MKFQIAPAASPGGADESLPTISIAHTGLLNRSITSQKEAVSFWLFLFHVHITLYFSPQLCFIWLNESLRPHSLEWSKAESCKLCIKYNVIVVRRVIVVYLQVKYRMDMHYFSASVALISNPFIEISAFSSYGDLTEDNELLCSCFHSLRSRSDSKAKKSGGSRESLKTNRHRRFSGFVLLPRYIFRSETSLEKVFMDAKKAALCS